MTKLKLLISSRKFWATLVALAMILINAFIPDFPFSEEQAQNFVLVLVSYIMGTALEDGLSRKLTFK